MEDLAGTQYLPKEFPYGSDEASAPLDDQHPARCRSCGSEHTSSYIRLMVAANPSVAISGDLLLHPIRVITCLSCNMISYRNYQSLRDF